MAVPTNVFEKTYLYKKGAEYLCSLWFVYCSAYLKSEKNALAAAAPAAAFADEAASAAA